MRNCALSSLRVGLESRAEEGERERGEGRIFRVFDSLTAFPLLFTLPLMSYTLLGAPVTLSPDSGGASTRGSHRLQDALTCERKWDYRYLQNLKQRDSHQDPYYRLWGSVMHLRIAYDWHAKIKARKLRNPRFPLSNWEPLEEAITKIASGRQNIIESTKNAMEAWKRWNTLRRVTPIAVEAEIAASLGEIGAVKKNSRFASEIVTSRVDFIGRDEDGATFIEDVKTVSSRRKDKTLAPIKHPSEWDTGLQMSTILHICRAIGIDADYIQIARVCREPPHHIDIVPVRIPPVVYDMAPRILAKAAKREFRIREAKERGVELPPSGTLSRQCGNCDYRELCMADSPELTEMIRDAQFSVGG